jgi:hypothetical protein
VTPSLLGVHPYAAGWNLGPGLRPGFLQSSLKLGSLGIDPGLAPTRTTPMRIHAPRLSAAILVPLIQLLPSAG